MLRSGQVPYAGEYETMRLIEIGYAPVGLRVELIAGEAIQIRPGRAGVIVGGAGLRVIHLELEAVREGVGDFENEPVVVGVTLVGHQVETCGSESERRHADGRVGVGVL